jgi:hypothetical protein
MAVGDIQIEIDSVEVDESDTPGEREVGVFPDAALVGGIDEETRSEVLGRVV